MDNEVIKWRREATLIMLRQGVEYWDIAKAIKELEPLVFGGEVK